MDSSGPLPTPTPGEWSGELSEAIREGLRMVPTQQRAEQKWRNGPACVKPYMQTYLNPTPSLRLSVL